MSDVDLTKMRRDYGIASLSESEVSGHWLPLFSRWFAAARDVVPEPNAMALATVGAAGVPSVRTVLAKSFDDDGLVFCSSSRSLKGQQLAENPQASVLFGWYELQRQVVFSGAVTQLSDEQTDVIFAVRPRGSQLAAHASQQSTVISSRAELEAAFARQAQRFAGVTVPRPQYWTGYRLLPAMVEFWQGGPDRLHDRLRYTAVGPSWVLERLAP